MNTTRLSKTHTQPGNHRSTERKQQPSLAQLERWMADGGCEATDGCWVETDGTCTHGCKSWLLVRGLI